MVQHVLKTYNRTILELKLVLRSCLYSGLPSYNRTILELKHEMSDVHRNATILIIAPFWN